MSGISPDMNKKKILIAHSYCAHILKEELETISSWYEVMTAVDYDEAVNAIEPTPFFTNSPMRSGG